MSATGPEVFDRMLQVTHVWLDEIMDKPGPGRQRVCHALRAVLHALRGVADVLLDRAVDDYGQTIVMGSYDHAFRNLKQITVPVLFSH